MKLFRIKKTGFNIVTFIFLIILTVSCSVNRNLVSTLTSYPDLNENQFFRHIKRQGKSSFSTLEYSRFNAQFKNNETQKSFKGFLRLKTDSIIMISVSPAMGIELFRLQLKTDSLALIDRYNKTYQVEDFNFFKRQFGINLNYEQFQALITGTLYNYDRKSNFNRFFKNEKNKYVIEDRYNGNSSNLSVIFYYNNQLLLKRVFIKDFKSGTSLTLDYNEYFTDIGGNNFPKTLKMTILKGTRIEILTLDFKEPVVNKSLNFPFSISDRYRRIEN